MSLGRQLQRDHQGLDLRQHKGLGQTIEISLLRHISLVEHLGAGDTVKLNVLELEAEGTATVLSVDPSPPIEDGPGQLVTGTFRSTHDDIRSIKLVGLDEPIGVTAKHPIFSEDDQDFVPVSTLSRGSRLRTRSGTVAVVESVTPLRGTHVVCNLEVEDVHQYYVSELDVLAHNACEVGSIEGANAVQSGMLTEAERAEIQGIADAYDTEIHVVGSRAAGEGRNIETDLPIRDPEEGPTRSDIDFRIDTAHPAVFQLIEDLKAVSNGAGSADIKYAITSFNPTKLPFIRFVPRR